MLVQTNRLAEQPIDRANLDRFLPEVRLTQID